MMETYQPASYTTNNLPAYTYSIAKANVQVSTGTIQLTTITSLNREISIDPTGTVTAIDTYKITSNATTSLSAFILNVPLGATNIAVRDQFGTSTNNKHSNRQQPATRKRNT